MLTFLYSFCLSLFSLDTCAHLFLFYNSVSLYFNVGVDVVVVVVLTFGR